MRFCNCTAKLESKAKAVCQTACVTCSLYFTHSSTAAQQHCRRVSTVSIDIKQTNKTLSVPTHLPGATLLSGSDDTRVCIWDVESRQCRTVVDTGHSANIFCVRYLPNTGADNPLPPLLPGCNKDMVRVFSPALLTRCTGCPHRRRCDSNVCGR